MTEPAPGEGERIEAVCKAAAAVVESVCMSSNGSAGENHAHIVLTFASSIHSAASLLSPTDGREEAVDRLGHALEELRSGLGA